jgi:Tfp pilus assembly protein PilO
MCRTAINRPAARADGQNSNSDIQQVTINEIFQSHSTIIIILLLILILIIGFMCFWKLYKSHIASIRRRDAVHQQILALAPLEQGKRI